MRKLVNRTREERKQLEDKLAFRALVSLGLVALLLISAIVWGIVAAFLWNLDYRPDYQREVGGHMRNAYFSETPELMIDNLKKAKQGMVNLGLEPNMYAALSWQTWRHTPDNRMDFQYRLIDDIIHRAEDIIEWREHQRSNGQSGEINDVYESKMNALKRFIHDANGWADDISYGAWVASEHPMYAVIGWIVFAYVLVIIPLVITGIIYTTKHGNVRYSY